MVLATGGSTLIYLKVSGTSVEEVKRTESSQEIACLNVSPLGESAFAHGTRNKTQNTGHRLQDTGHRTQIDIQFSRPNDVLVSLPDEHGAASRVRCQAG